MKRTVTRSLPILLGLLAAARAEFPLESMGPNRLGLQYGFALRGQDITSQDVPSHETLHTLNLGYSPLPYLGLEAGIGADEFSVDRHNGARFSGGYGLTPVFGATLATPSLLDLLRVAGGARFLYLDSEDNRGYAYSGWVSSPFLSVILSPSAYFDLEAGARGHLISGDMQGPNGVTQTFSNRETVRGFVSFTLKSPSDFAFLTFDADFSTAADPDWSNGPREASIGISFGTLLGWKAKSQEPKTAPTYFPAYPEMKEKQKKMEEELE
ncbi:MAG: hypothetical protein JF616_11450 [Fibrobacteres bacterium]|nr:hypothetical protein [Fibrobacterota bacterium]